MTEERVRVLLVDDEESLREPLGRFLEDRFGYLVDAVASGGAALDLVKEARGQYDVALIDEMLLDGPDGIETMQHIKALYPNVEALIFTGWGTESKQRAIRAGAFRYLEKPFDSNELAMLIRTAAQQVRLRNIGRAILSERDPDQVLASIVGAACSLALADEAAIVLVEQATGKLKVHAKIYPTEQQWRRHFQDHNLSREIIRTGQVVQVPDTTQDGRVDQKVIASGIRSFLGLPIPGEGGSLGVLYVYSRRSGRFEEWGTVAVLQTLAGQAGLAIANAQAFQQVHTHAGYMEALMRSGQGLSQATDLRVQLEPIWQFVREQLRISTFFVALYDRLTDTLSFPLFYDKEKEVSLLDKVLGDDPEQWGIAGWIVKRGKELHWPTGEDREQECKFLGIKPNIVGDPCQTCSYLPLRSEDEIIGVMSIQSYDRYAFDDVLLNAIRALGSQLIVALDNTRLFDEANHRVRNLETLQDLALTVNFSLDLDETLRRACQAAVDFFNADHSGLVLFHSDHSQGQVRAEYPPLGTPHTIIPLCGVPAEERLIKTRQPLVIHDVATEESLGPVQDILLGFDIQSLLIVPVVGKNEKLLGSFSLDAVGRRQKFTAEEVELCQVFAAYVAVAVENVRLFSQLSEAKEWREALIESAFDAVVAIDKSKKITVFNQRAEEMFGWKAEEVIGYSVARLYLDIEKAKEVFDVVNGGKPVTGWSVDLKHQDDTLIPALLSATLIRDNQGNPIGQAGFMRDLREVNLLEDRLRALIRVSQAITGTLELDEVLDQVMKSELDAFPTARGGTIHMYDERADVLRPRANTYGSSPGAIEALSFNVGEGIAGWVYAHRQPLVVDDVQQDTRYKLIDHPGIPVHKSLICVPLRVKEQVIGTLSLDNMDTPGAFQAEDLELLSTFADQAAIAIDNAQRVQALERMRRAAVKLTSVTKVQKVLQQIVRSAREILEADSSVIWSYNDVRHTFLPDELAAEGIEPELIEKFRENEPYPGGTAEMVMERDYLAVTDVHDPEYAFLGQIARGLWEEIGARAFQGIALEVGEERLAVLYVNYNRPQSFTTEDRRTLEIFAYHAAMALKKARLLEQVSRARDAARSIANVMTLEDLAATLESIVKATTEVADCDAVTLYAYNQDKDNFLYPPTTLGLRDEEGVRWLDRIDVNSVIWKILALDRPHVADDAPGDSLMKGQQQGRLPPFVVREGVKSSVGLPLKAGARKVGVMFVNYRSRHRLTGEELINIELFANQAAVAIRNAQLYEETTRRANALQALYEASRAVTGTLTPDELLNHIVEQAWRLAEPRGEKTHFSHLALVDGNHIRFVAAYPPEVLIRLRDRVDAIDLEKDMPIGITGRVIVTRRSQLVRNVLEDSDYIKTDPRVCSQLSVPVQIEEQVVGVVSVEHPGCNTFDEDDRRDLESLSAQAAIAIQNARLYQQATERLNESQALQRVATSLAGTLELEEVLQVVMTAAMDLTGTDSGSILFWDSQAETFTHTLTTAGTDRTLQRYRGRAQREGGIARAIIDKQKAIVIPDARKDSRVNPVALEKGRRALIGVPLVSHEEVIGVLYVSSSEHRQFSDRQVALLESLASQAVLAIERARQYEELKQAKGLVGARTALAWMGMAGSAWRHAIDKHALTIREQSQLIRADLSKMRTCEQDARIAERLSMVERLANRVLEKPIVPPLSREEGAASVSVNELIGERARQLWQNDPYKSVELRLDLQLSDGVAVYVSPEWLRRAFDILVDNAVDAIARCEVREVTVGTQAADGGIKIVVSDTGPGIPEDIRAKIGLDLIEKPEDTKGLGMGLLMAQTIVQTYGGEIRVASTGPTGTTMVIWLPLEKAES